MKYGVILLVYAAKFTLVQKIDNNLSKHNINNYTYDIKYALPIIRQANIVILASKWQRWCAKRLSTTLKLLKLLNLTKEQQLFIIGSKSFENVNQMNFE